jgi:nucleoid-associated protein YgaU
MLTDGHRVEVVANIGKPEEAAAAIEAGAEGVGLMRTEFLFLGRNDPPGEEEQFKAYSTMVHSLNGLTLTSVIQPGTELRIPQTGKGFPDTRALHKHPTTYTVKAGDTIYTIGCYYGDVDPLVIASLNGIASPYKLTAGQTLNIP